MTNSDWDHIQQYGDKLLHSLEQVAGTGLKVATEITRVNCIENAVQTIVWLVLSAIFLKCCMYFNKRYSELDDKGKRDDENGYVPLCVTSGAISLVSGIAGLVGFTNVWTWVGIFNPQLEFAREIMSKIMGN